MRTRFATALLVAATSACASSAEDVEMDDFDDFADGKVDTGYFGSRAAELEATLTGRVKVALPGKSAAELEAIAEALRADPQSWTHRDIVLQVSEQIKYGRNALKASKLNQNLEGGDPTFSEIAVTATGLELAYEVKVESLIKYKDLEAQGLKASDLVGQTIAMRLPATPDGLLERISNQCATDPDSNAGVDAGELGAHNLFYYWDPGRAGCPLTGAELIDATYKVTSSNDVGTLYPEYDQLVADNKITMVQIFGQIEHGDLQSNDWGFYSFNDVTRILRDDGFRKTATFADNTGHKLSKTFASGLLVEIDMYTPVLFADTVPREQSNETFKQAMRSHELVYYAGHAFYGSLDVLDDRTAYPTDTYQVFFMDACWSYAYYTKQVFRNKATEADPSGWQFADVLNNTEPGITGSERTAMVMFQNLWKGADAKVAGRSTTRYSWNNLIVYMNEHAQRRADARGEDNPEIYGVSGVHTNAFRP